MSQPLNQDESHFLALKILAERAKADPENAGWFVMKAYQLASGCGINETLEMPPKPEPEITLWMIEP